MRILFCVLLFSFVSSVKAQEATSHVNVDLNKSERALISFDNDFISKLSNPFIRIFYDGEEVDEFNIDQISNESIVLEGYGKHQFRIYSRYSFSNPGTLITDEPGTLRTSNILEWQQDVYVPYPSPNNAENLARQYLPITVYHEEEEYFPQSLEEILSFSNSSDGNFIKISNYELNVNGNISSSYPAEVSMGVPLLQFLSGNGHSSSSFDFTTNESTCDLDGLLACNPLFLRDSTGLDSNMSRVDPVVYWDSSIENDILYLTYWYFYAFDPKNGSRRKPGDFAHALDRESVTITFALNTQGEYIPKGITYAGHLPDQTINFLGCIDTNCNVTPGFGIDGLFSDNLLSWSGGKTTLSWNQALKLGKHPVLYKAKGAHAIYPAYGFYGVVTKAIEGLVEEAGSLNRANVLTPEQFRLKNLDFSAMPYLSFSGNWVDLRLSSGAKFPPFTNRHPYGSWLSDSDFAFENCLNQDDCSVSQYFEEIRGLNGMQAVTIDVINSDGDLASGSNIRLIGSDGTARDQTALSDGQTTFFFYPEEGVAYTLAIVSSEGELSECGGVDLMDAIPNNGLAISCVRDSDIQDIIL